MFSSPLDKYLRDTDGKKFKYPDRDCKRCVLYKCVLNMHKLRCNFAKYGCRDYKENQNF